MDLLHREQSPGFVRLGHNLIIALEVPAGGPICNLTMPALHFGARRSACFRIAVGLRANGKSGSEAAASQCPFADQPLEAIEHAGSAPSNGAQGFRRGLARRMMTALMLSLETPAYLREVFPCLGCT